MLLVLLLLLPPRCLCLGHCGPQLTAKRCSQRGWHSVPHLLVPHGQAASELEVVWEALLL
jgi:hypothetical protein